MQCASSIAQMTASFTKTPHHECYENACTSVSTTWDRTPVPSQVERTLACSGICGTPSSGA
jgi:hypothetical protein